MSRYTYARVFGGRLAHLIDYHTANTECGLSTDGMMKWYDIPDDQDRKIRPTCTRCQAAREARKS